MSTPSNLMSVARRILQAAGRPLSARRILHAAAVEGLLDDDGPTAEVLRQALADARDVREIRRGVFALAEEEPEEEPEPEEEDAEGEEDEEEEEEPEEEDDERGGRRRRRRRTRLRDLVGEAPPVALTVEDAVVEAESMEDRATLRRRLWEKMRSRAGEVVGEAPAAAEEPSRRAPRAPAPAPVAPAAEVTDPRALLKARLAARKEQAAQPVAPAPGSAPPPAPPPPKAPEPVVDPAALVRARLAERRGVVATAVEATGEAYVERREAPQPVPPAEERRAPTLRELPPTDAQVAAALEWLRARARPAPVAELAPAVGAPTPKALRAALLAENARRSAAGLRAPFAVQWSGEVGLTEWGLSARYRALEETVHGALAEMREIVRRDLLRRVGELPDAAFEQVVRMLLEQLGHRDVEVVHRQDGGYLALTTSRPRDGATVAVVASRAWTPVGRGTVTTLARSLEHFEAAEGLLLTMGTFSPEALAEAEVGGGRRITALDGAGFARLLNEHGIGLSSHHPVIPYVDGAFFDSLE